MVTVAAVFDTEEHAREAFRRLQDAGVSGDDISLALREDAHRQERHEELVHDADHWAGASVGAAIGGTGGWIAGAAAAGAALAIPVVGPVLAIGALAGTDDSEPRARTIQNLERVRAVLRMCDGKEYRAG